MPAVGLGEATVRMMACEGAPVVIADINGSAAECVAGELEHAVVAEVDVSDESSVIRMIETAVESFGWARRAAQHRHGPSTSLTRR